MKDKISRQQFESFWLWLEQWSHELNNNGVTFQMIMEQVKNLESRPNKDNIYQGFIKEYNRKTFGKEHLSDLTNAELNELQDALIKFFGYYWHIYIPFPSDEKESAI